MLSLHSICCRACSQGSFALSIRLQSGAHYGILDILHDLRHCVVLYMHQFVIHMPLFMLGWKLAS